MIWSFDSLHSKDKHQQDSFLRLNKDSGHGLQNVDAFSTLQEQLAVRMDVKVYAHVTNIIFSGGKRRAILPAHEPEPLTETNPGV